MSRFTIQILNSYPELERAIREISKLLESKEVPPGLIHTVNLGLEEVVTNILKYGYDDKLEHKIEIALVCAKSNLRIEVADDGHEFNPLQHPEPDRQKPVEDRQPGGLGISVLRKLFNAVEYRRQAGRNILMMVKDLEQD